MAFTFAQDSAARRAAAARSARTPVPRRPCSAQNNLPVINTSHYTALTAAEFNSSRSGFIRRAAVARRPVAEPAPLVTYRSASRRRRRSDGGNPPSRAGARRGDHGPRGRAAPAVPAPLRRLHKGMLATRRWPRTSRTSSTCLRPSARPRSRLGPGGGPDLSGGTQVGGYVWSITSTRRRGATRPWSAPAAAPWRATGRRGRGRTRGRRASAGVGQELRRHAPISCVDSSMLVTGALDRRVEGAPTSRARAAGPSASRWTRRATTSSTARQPLDPIGWRRRRPRKRRRPRTSRRSSRRCPTSATCRDAVARQRGRQQRRHGT